MLFRARQAVLNLKETLLGSYNGKEESNNYYFFRGAYQVITEFIVYNLDRYIVFSEEISLF